MDELHPTSNVLHHPSERELAKPSTYCRHLEEAQLLRPHQGVLGAQIRVQRPQGQQLQNQEWCVVLLATKATCPEKPDNNTNQPMSRCTQDRNRTEQCWYADSAA